MAGEESGLALAQLIRRGIPADWGEQREQLGSPCDQPQQAPRLPCSSCIGGHGTEP